MEGCVRWVQNLARKSLRGLLVGLPLLAGSIGCQQTGLLGFGRGKIEDPGTARNPATFVAFGDLRIQLAQTPDLAPVAQQLCWEEARLAYQHALKVDPHFLPAHLGLARLYSTMGDTARAEAAYQKGTQAQPHNATIWYETGMLQSRMRSWHAASHSVQKALELDPDNRQYANTYGFILAHQGRYAESLEAFTRLSGPARAHFNLARLLHHENHLTEARHHAQMALNYDPNLTNAYRLLDQIAGKSDGVPGRTH